MLASLHANALLQANASALGVPVAAVGVPAGRGPTGGVQEEPPDQQGPAMGRQLDPDGPAAPHHDDTVTMTTTVEGNERPRIDRSNAARLP